MQALKRPGMHAALLQTRRRCLALLFSVLFPTAAFSATPAQSPETFRLCSQNLYRFGDTHRKGGEAAKKKQKEDLVSRFEKARCDVVAVQEVFGMSPGQARQNLRELAAAWSRRIDQPVRAEVGESSDKYIRNGFLIRERAGTVVESRSFAGEHLPRLQPLGPIGTFLRAPLLLVFDANLGAGRRQRYWILNLHFKSKSFAFKDPTGSEFENIRMEMAEGVRNIVDRELRTQPPSTVAVVTGDRNNDLQSATAEILEGRRRLDDFVSGRCRLTADEQPDCGAAPPRTAELVGLFEQRRQRFPGRYRGGSYAYHSRQELLDEIYLRKQDLEHVELPGRQLNIAIEGEFFRGSDHKLVWAEFR
jgi:hypothetical protein